MAIHLVTGHRGTAHVTSADQGAFNAACVGTGDVVLNVGQRFNTQVISNNLIRIFDGDLSMQGRHVNLERGTHVDVTIENGMQAQYRNDLIVMRYTKNVTTGIEDAEFSVIKGATYTDAGIDPQYTTGDIFSGATSHEMPMYRVRLNGLNIVAVEPMFTMVGSLADMQTAKNLLLNSDFTSNQRRSTTYSAASAVKYSLDMWRIHNVKVDVLAEGVKVTGTSASSTGYLTQFVDVTEHKNIPHTITAMVDGKICTFTLTLTSTAQEKVFDKCKISALRTSNHIKVNICPIGTNSMTIKYVDLFEGTVSYPHVKEDPAITLAKCRRYIQRNSNSYPIIYSYPNSSNENQRSYKFNVPCDGIISTPTVESGGWGYYNNIGDWISGTTAELMAVSPTATTVTMRTPNRAIKHSDCYAIDVWCILTCEHAPNGDS